MRGMADMPDDAPAGTREDPALLLHAASMATPVVMVKACLAKLEIFISICVSTFFQ
jgi:hypothetical protein